MGANERIETRFRNRLRAERERRNWSQAHLAKMLADKGLGVYPTTIAKIETGDRQAKLDEIAAIAEVFEVSIDTLVGRSAKDSDDLTFTLRALAGIGQQASWQLATIETTLRERAAEVAAFNPTGIAKTVVDGCRQAADSISEATAMLRDTLDPPGRGAAQRAIRKLLIDQLQREDTHDET